MKSQRTAYITIAITVEANNITDDEDFVDILDDMNYTFEPAAHHDDVKFVNTTITAYQFLDDKQEPYDP